MKEKLVVDSGIAVKWFAAEADSPRALLIYDEFGRNNIELLAPDLIYAELRKHRLEKIYFSKYVSIRSRIRSCGISKHLY